MSRGACLGVHAAHPFEPAGMVAASSGLQGRPSSAHTEPARRHSPQPEPRAGGSPDVLWPLSQLSPSAQNRLSSLPSSAVLGPVIPRQQESRSVLTGHAASFPGPFSHKLRVRVLHTERISRRNTCKIYKVRCLICNRYSPNVCSTWEAFYTVSLGEKTGRSNMFLVCNYLLMMEHLNPAKSSVSRPGPASGGSARAPLGSHSG